MKKIILAIFGILAVSISLSAQVKNPPATAEKKYTISLTQTEWNFVDSTMRKSHYWVGRSMLLENADPLKSDLAGVINFFGAMVAAQDSTAKKQK